MCVCVCVCVCVRERERERAIVFNNVCQINMAGTSCPHIELQNSIVANGNCEYISWCSFTILSYQLQRYLTALISEQLTYSPMNRRG